MIIEKPGTPFTNFVEKSATRTFNYALTTKGILDTDSMKEYTISSICDSVVAPTGTAKVLFDMAGNVVKIIAQ